MKGPSASLLDFSAKFERPALLHRLVSVESARVSLWVLQPRHRHWQTRNDGVESRGRLILRSKKEK